MFSLPGAERSPGLVTKHRATWGQSDAPGEPRNSELSLCQGTGPASLRVDSALGRESSWALHTLCGLGQLPVYLWEHQLPHVKDEGDFCASSVVRITWGHVTWKNLVVAKTPQRLEAASKLLFLGSRFFLLNKTKIVLTTLPVLQERWAKWSPLSLHHQSKATTHHLVGFVSDCFGGKWGV